MILAKDGEYRPMGFPDRFLIECILEGGETEILADYREEDYEIQGIEPQLFPRAETPPVKGIRLTATQLSSNEISNEIWSPEKYRLALSEIMVFVGEENVALGEKISVQGSSPGDRGWYITKLLDGFFTFSPVDREIVEENKSFVIHADEVEIVFDLGKPHKIDAFRMWPVSQEFHRSYLHTSGHGFPTSISIWAVSDIDTPEEKLTQICESSIEVLKKPGSTPFHRDHDPRSARFIKVCLAEPVVRDEAWGRRIYLSELELLSDGVCVSSGVLPWVKVTAPEEAILMQPVVGCDVRTLTDGVVEEGIVLPLRSWVEKINQRFLGERRRSLLRKEIQISEDREKNAYRILTLLLLTAAAILGLVIWIIKLYSRQRLSLVRDQIACDIHDEIGANISSIALAQDLLRKSIKQSTEFQSELMEDSITTARKTASEATQIVKFLEGRAFRRPLEEQIEEAGNQILRGTDVSYAFGAGDLLARLSPARKWDLLFFTKEVFNNILKHSKASVVTVSCSKVGGRAEIVIKDNGCGMAQKGVSLIHLEKRSQRLRADLRVDSEEGSGTTIVLRLK